MPYPMPAPLDHALALVPVVRFDPQSFVEWIGQQVVVTHGAATVDWAGGQCRRGQVVCVRAHCIMLVGCLFGCPMGYEYGVMRHEYYPDDGLTQEV
jgi:hypothetical protein